MWRTRLAAFIEVAGGLIGFGILLLAPGSSSPTSSLLLGAIAFSLCVVAGILLLLGRPLARPLSIALQLAQVPHVAIAGWGVQFYAGLIVGIAFFNTTDPSTLLAGLGAGFLLHTGESPSFYQVGLNVAPLAVLLLILHVRKPGAHAA
jgi:hypothetical protein